MDVIIIHGCPSNREKAMDEERRTYDKHWIPWIKMKLEEKRIKVETPLMPEPWNAKYNEWKKKFEEFEVNERSVLIGTSCGGGFLVRWLGDTGKKVKKLILIAPAIVHSGNYKPLYDLLKFKINKNIKSNIGEIIIFVSDDDEKGILKSAEIFSRDLKVKPIRFKNHGHFTLGDMGTEEFPKLLREVLR
ncbi:MAG: alpha/beta hydrolase [Candidatus Pacearchaeota archaeon]|nr:alpha/beta hydrolase [Candidatus Pacearchaeota archaeon]